MESSTRLWGVCARSVCAAIVLLSASPPSLAQDAPPTPAEVALRREIATMRDRLAQAEERIRQLEGERAGLLEELAKARQSASDRTREASESAAGGTPGEIMASVPADPFASPASMLNEIRKRYEAKFASVPHDTEAAIAAYKEDVRAWCAAGQRDLRDRSQWLVRVLELKEIAEDRRFFGARLRVIDEASGLPIGPAFSARIPAGDARIIERGKDRFPFWRATVVVAGTPAYNEQRGDAGVFEHPPFVGRYCDFAIEIEFRHVAGVREEDLKKAAPPPPSR